jgi:acyl-CoA synthetase (AMP-forming)/AMP-acid ligase II
MQRIATERITMLPGPPTLYHSILDHPDFGSTDLSSLRLAVTGAAAIPVELILRMRRELAFETIITGYGLTESCGIATMCRFDDDAETIATTSGRAIPELEVLCVDPDGTEVPRGEPGEVVVRGHT